MPAARAGQRAQTLVSFDVCNAPTVRLDNHVFIVALACSDPTESETACVDLLVDPNEELPDPIGCIIRWRVQPGLQTTRGWKIDSQPGPLPVSLSYLDVEYC